jgi:cation/acetate symporter
VITLLGDPRPGWIGALLAQPAAWTVPLAFATMVVVSLLTPFRLPVHVSRTMVRLHTPEAVALDRGPQSL